MSSASCGEKKRLSRPSRSSSATLSRTRRSSVWLHSTSSVVEALLLEARADPGPQERRVEGLRQVVRRAQLDAADHAVELVHRRDHDHRDRPEPVVGLQPLQHLVAVQLRHHDVQQEEVERARPEKLERLAAVAAVATLVYPRDGDAG